MPNFFLCLVAISRHAYQMRVAGLEWSGSSQLQLAICIFEMWKEAAVAKKIGENVFFWANGSGEKSVANLFYGFWIALSRFGLLVETWTEMVC